MLSMQFACPTLPIQEMLKPQKAIHRDVTFMKILKTDNGSICLLNTWLLKEKAFRVTIQVYGCLHTHQDENVHFKTFLYIFYQFQRYLWIEDFRYFRFYDRNIFKTKNCLNVCGNFIIAKIESVTVFSFYTCKYVLLGLKQLFYSANNDDDAPIKTY